jgi:hypothetical protein
MDTKIESAINVINEKSFSTQSAHCGPSPLDHHAAAQPVIAVIHAERSILSAQTSVCGLCWRSLQLRQAPIKT